MNRYDRLHKWYLQLEKEIRTVKDLRNMNFILNKMLIINKILDILVNKK